MKKILITFAVLLLGSLKVNASFQFLLVTQNDGQLTGFALSDQPMIEYPSGYLSISSSQNTISIPLGDVLKIEYVNELPAGIVEIKYNSDDASVKYGHVVIKSLPSNSVINVYTIGGTIISSMVSDDSGYIEFDLPQSDTPLIIKTKTRSFKVINK